MPRVSEFYGIAVYDGQQVEVAIQTGNVLAGALPKRAMRLVPEWAGEYEPELLENWRLAREGKPLNPVPPLA